MSIMCFLSHGADGAINDTIALTMLRWLLQGTICDASTDIDGTIAFWMSRQL